MRGESFEAREKVRSVMLPVRLLEGFRGRTARGGGDTCRGEEEDKKKRKEECIEYVCPLGSFSLLQLIAAGIFCGGSQF